MFIAIILVLMILFAFSTLILFAAWYANVIDDKKKNEKDFDLQQFIDEEDNLNIS